MLSQVLKDLKEDQENRERSNADTIARLDKLNQALDGLNEQGQKMEDTLRAARIRLERALKQASVILLVLGSRLCADLESAARRLRSRLPRALPRTKSAC